MATRETARSLLRTAAEPLVDQGGDSVVGGFDPVAVPTFDPAIDDWC